jgi:hydrogenase-4 component B
MTISMMMILGYLAGALSALLLRGRLSRWCIAAGTLTGAVAGIVVALQGMISQAAAEFMVPAAEPLLRMTFTLDPLGAFFLLLIGVAAIASAVYGIGYTADAQSPRLLGFMLNLFLLSMSLVVMASNVLAFLVFWEGMSLASYFLVISESQSPETLSAGVWYAGMAHAGFASIALALLLAAGGTPGMLFAEIRPAILSPALKNLVFVLALLGFGSKAGLVPLHVWLPKAHPAAPSHISALMSGVMVKLGIYGILRVSLDLLGGGPAWWGGLILMLGAGSALLGVLYALMEHDLKRLLAYHTVENVGLIAMGVGLALIFRSHGLAEVAALALVAALFHTLNHGIFKGLLFMGAGAVLHATGTRNMEEMGGLIRHMPVTSVCFLIGAAAISGLPPLNGFASEWMLFQSLMAGTNIPQSLFAALMAVGVGILALTAGLAAACFVKAFGISFLAIPRSHKAENAHEVPGTMRTGMLFLAAACVLLGVLANWTAIFIARATAGIPGIAAGGVRFSLGALMTVPGQSSRVSPILMALLLLVAAGLVPIAFRLFRVNPKLRFADSWGCGRVNQSPRMEYTGTAFAEPLRRIFSALYRPTKDVTIDFHPESKYFVQSIQYRSEVRSWFEELLYEPLSRGVERLGDAGRRIQSGSIHLYIGYIFLALLTLLLLSRWL